MPAVVVSAAVGTFGSGLPLVVSALTTVADNQALLLVPHVTDVENDTCRHGDQISTLCKEFQTAWIARNFAGEALPA